MYNGILGGFSPFAQSPTSGGDSGANMTPEQQQIAMQIAKHLIGQQPGQTYQSWTQPLAQIANSYVAGQYMKKINDAQRAGMNAATGMPFSGASSSSSMPMTDNIDDTMSV